MSHTPFEAADYRKFHIRGSHAHAGFVLGSADPPFQMQFWWQAPPTKRFALACRSVVRELHPPLLDELDAYADAQRYPRDELWRKCCRVNLKARVRPEHLQAGFTTEFGEGCSTFVRFTQQGVVVGRNYDYLPQQVRRQRIGFQPDCCAHASVGARGSVPCGRYDGMNAHGLFVSLHVVMTDLPDEAALKPGVPFHLVPRLALETCTSAREAADLIAHMPHLSALNYLVADAEEAFVIEADPRRTRVLAAEGDTLAATNHFRHPDMVPLMGNRATAHSECRLAFLHRAEPTGDLLRWAMQVMADRSVPMCGLSGALITLWSCVAELRSRRIFYAPGPPALTPYEEMTHFISPRQAGNLSGQPAHTPHAP